jgi:hypothetical protein
VRVGLRTGHGDRCRSIAAPVGVAAAEDQRRVTVEGVAGPVVAAGGAGVGVAHGILHVFEGNAEFAGVCGERVAQGVRGQPAG